MKEQDRLLALMQSEGLNAKEFALQVGISAATMSNVINGRNNPSLEVMQKVLNRFRNVSPNWLILGVGSMYLEKSNSHGDKSDQNSPQNTDFPGSNDYPAISGANTEFTSPASQATDVRTSGNQITPNSDNRSTTNFDINSKSPCAGPNSKHSVPTIQPSNSKQVVRVLVFYNDGTFDELHK